MSVLISRLILEHAHVNLSRLVQACKKIESLLALSSGYLNSVYYLGVYIVDFYICEIYYTTKSKAMQISAWLCFNEVKF